MPSKTNVCPPADQPISQISRPVSQTENPTLLAGTQPARTDSMPGYSAGVRPGASTERASLLTRPSIIREASPVIPAASTSQLIIDALSQFYHDKAKRDIRRISSIGDIYADVNRDALQRFMQGEQVPITVEEGGTYLSSLFILVENRSLLYLNFYQFNEEKPVSQDRTKILSQIFDIRGNLPDLVKICKPAQVISQNGGYVIANKGILLLEGSGD
jgi:hypothetical protein